MENMENNLNGESYSWNIGTTSFRVKELKYHIERQLLLLDQFNNEYSTLDWNKEKQTLYAQFLNNDGLFKIVKTFDKDARVKTSSLAEIGLVTDKRQLTKVGYSLIKNLKQIDDLYLQQNTDIKNNIFDIRADSYIYLKQLLKYQAKGFNLKPLLAVIYTCLTFGEADLDFICYILPQCKTKEEVINSIHIYKRNKNFTEAVKIFIKDSSNTKKAIEIISSFQYSTNTSRSEIQGLLSKILTHGKGEAYLKKTFELFFQLYEYWSNKNEWSQSEKIRIIKEINFRNIRPKAATKLNKIILGVTKLKKSENWNIIIEHFESIDLVLSETFQEFIKNFYFIYELGKRLANLEEYKDLNLRYLSLTDIFVAENNTIKLDLLPKVIFEECKDYLLDAPLVENEHEYKELLGSNIDIHEIHDFFTFSITNIQRKIKILYPEFNNTLYSLNQFAELKKKERFNHLIENRFSIHKLVELLELLKCRDDSTLQKEMNCEADPSTIFEYLIGICWYLLNEKKGDLFKIFNLYLDANLLPQRFASGGKPDMIYTLEDHDLIIEVTLAKKENQRRMELEPVSRHLGRHKLKIPHKDSYCIFVAPYLDPNVLVSFRAYKNLRYYDTDNINQYVTGLNILPINIDNMINILKSKKTYTKLKQEFFNIFNSSEMDGLTWYSNEIDKCYK